MPLAGGCLRHRQEDVTGDLCGERVIADVSQRSRRFLALRSVFVCVPSDSITASQPAGDYPILSLPTHGRKTSGTLILPSACC
jgi:hypothetical protein